MAVIPVNFIAAYAIGYFYNVVKVKRLGFSFIFLSLALLITPCLGAQDIANTMPHSANDALVETANYIKQNTKENAELYSLVSRIMKYINKGCSLEKIARKTGA
jgi:hypothetical protein